MDKPEEVYFFLSPEVHRYLADNDISTSWLLKQTGKEIAIRLGENPAPDIRGEKEPATILLASAAVIAAATPILREVLRTFAGRDPVIRERRLVPVADSSGELVRDANGQPVLQWVDEIKGLIPESPIQSGGIKGFGIEISFGDK
ncbi:hypothetical protein [Achromobacter aegrifaciens]|uniref:hypothetical protein n=1 Tax=Achromobacter aegrifaciens TaxID=1287736 RepID=UPI001583B62A|nr:hypothetical protein [Achromobacter aegrifaciens]